MSSPGLHLYFIDPEIKYKGSGGRQRRPYPLPPPKILREINRGENKVKWGKNERKFHIFDFREVL